MNITSTLGIGTATAFLFTGTVVMAKDVRPQDAVIKISAAFLVQANSGSEKSQGLPNADGGKPGKGNGYGHLKGVGQGHGKGRGHGHDGDPISP